MGSIKMFATLVLLSLFSISFGSSSDYLAYTSYAGLEVQDQSTMSTEVMTAMDHLNRYCGGGSYYYRPSYGCGPNLGNLISPVVFGLATGARLAAVGSLFGK